MRINKITKERKWYYKKNDKDKAKKNVKKEQTWGEVNRRNVHLCKIVNPCNYFKTQIQHLEISQKDTNEIKNWLRYKTSELILTLKETL
jgi:predicted metal-binding transcription factor (methanogenesis marker protein 9)